MGLTEDEFWRLTPRQFTAILKRHTEKLRRSDYGIASLIAAIYNAPHRDPKGKWVTADDFLGHKDRHPVQTPEQQLQFIRMFNAAAGGETVEKVGD